jgi:hypothetical protein
LEKPFFSLGVADIPDIPDFGVSLSGLSALSGGGAVGFAVLAG